MSDVQKNTYKTETQTLSLTLTRMINDYKYAWLYMWLHAYSRTCEFSC